MNIAVFAGGELWRLPEKQDWDMVICAGFRLRECTKVWHRAWIWSLEILIPYLLKH